MKISDAARTIAAEARKIPGGLSIAIGTIATGSRSAQENAEILQRQAGEGRDPMELSGIDEAISGINQFQDKGFPAVAAGLNRLADRWEKDIKDNFGTGKPNAERYAKWKRKKVGHACPLIFTGELQRSIAAGVIKVK